MTPFDVEQWLSARKVRAADLRCPSCGATKPLPLVLGMPGVEIGDAWERGEVALGGCIVPSGPSPQWRCRRCGFEFPDEDVAERERG